MSETVDGKADAHRPAGPAAGRDRWLVEAGGHTDTGPVRSHNEDAFLLEPKLGLFAVADGMGGHQAGEIASRMAVTLVRDFFLEARAAEMPFDDELLREAILQANRLIRAEAKRVPERQGMGTTATVLLATGERYWIGHVGDSRAWQVRLEGPAERLTHDHSVIEEGIRNGALSPDVAEDHPLRNMLTRALGGAAELTVDILAGTIEADATFVLASDGLVPSVDEEELADVVRQSAGAAEAARELVHLACTRDGRDNVTVVTLRFHRAER